MPVSSSKINHINGVLLPVMEGCDNVEMSEGTFKDFWTLSGHDLEVYRLNHRLLASIIIEIPSVDQINAPRF